MLISPSFMILKLLVDENVRREIVEFLKEAGHDVKRLKAGVSDTEVAEAAAEEKRIIITHDLDFADIFAYPPEKYFGIVVLRISPPLANVAATALDHLFSTLKPEEFHQRLIILEAGGFRMRQAGE